MKKITFIILIILSFLRGAADPKIIVETDPSGVKVTLDGIELGITPVSETFPQGTYNIRIDDPNYEPINETVEIKPPETKLFYKLKDIRAMLTINAPVNAKVLINGSLSAVRNNIRLTPQMVKVRVEFDDSTFREETVLLGKCENKVIDLFSAAEKNTVLQLAVTPNDADVELYENGSIKYNFKGSKIISGISPGKYAINVKKNGYKKYVKEIEVKENGTEKLSVKLIKIGNGGDDMIFVQGGKFNFGYDKQYNSGKGINIQVSDFYIGKYEVTQELFKKVTGSNPSRDRGDKLPVNNIDWYEAVEFCNMLSERESLEKCYILGRRSDQIACDFSKNGYRLPTEAEWEFAAKGGIESKGYLHSGSDKPWDVSWGKDNNKDEKIKPVGLLLPNEVGLYDMNGNAGEIVWDWFTDKPDYAPDEIDPKGPASGKFRTVRGGDISDRDFECSVAKREPKYLEKNGNEGFRIARTANLGE